MATIKSFEDLELWQRARVFAQKVYAISLDGDFSKDYSLKNQINASSGSIMDNIAEGFERGGTKEFILFLSYAKGSAGESRSQLYRAYDRKHITEHSLSELKEEAIQISKRISGFMTYLKGTPFKWSKFQEPKNYGYGDEEIDS